MENPDCRAQNAAGQTRQNGEHPIARLLTQLKPGKNQFRGRLKRWLPLRLTLPGGRLVRCTRLGQPIPFAILDACTNVLVGVRETVSGAPTTLARWASPAGREQLQRQNDTRDELPRSQDSRASAVLGIKMQKQGNAPRPV